MCLWLPLRTNERQVHYETYREDIWTTLRGNANLKELTVVDLGRAILRPTDIPVDVRSIFSSTVSADVHSYFLADPFSDIHFKKSHISRLENVLLARR